VPRFQGAENHQNVPLFGFGPLFGRLWVRKGKGDLQVSVLLAIEEFTSSLMTLLGLTLSGKSQENQLLLKYLHYQLDMFCGVL